MQDKKTNNGDKSSDRGTPAFYSVLFENREIGGRSTKRARSLASIRPTKWFDTVVHMTSYASTRAYGWFLMTFGLVSLFLHLAEYYFASSPSEQLSQLVIGAVLALLSIPLMLVDMPMCEALQRFPVTNYIFFEFFSIKRISVHKKKKQGYPIIGMLIGLIPAVFGFFFPMEWVVLVIIAAIFIVVSFVSPEFPFLVMLMLVPYAALFDFSGDVMIAISILTLFSFFAKVMLGKRHYSVGMSDICIIVFAAVIVVFGVIGGGRNSTGVSMALVAFSLNYIPATNITVNRRLADCAIDATVFSSLPVSIVAVVRYVINLFTTGRAPESSVMSSPYILATYLCVVLSLVAFSITGASGSIKRGLYVTLLVTHLLALLTTECIPVLIVLGMMVVARAIMLSRKVRKEMLIPLAIVPAFVFVLPNAALSAISSVSPMSMTLVELRAGLLRSLQIFRESIFIGVGASDLSGEPTGAVLNSILGLGYRFGIFAVVVLCVVCAIRLHQDTLHTLFLKSSQLSAFSNMTTVAMFAMAACGWFCDVFADIGLYCLFFSMFGLNTAALRISRNEYQERQWYFKDQKDVDSSTVDVFLHR